MSEYRKRIGDELLLRKLKGKGAVLVEGAKWCGKTTTAEQLAKSVIYLDDPDQRENNIELSNIKPSLLLKGDNPRLIDEWQIAPKLWDAIRFEVDHRDQTGQFILTGSSTPIETDDITHSGTGRFSYLLMRPMSLFESGESNGSVSLKELFDNSNNISGESKIDLEQLAFLTCRGGWPKAIDFTDEDLALDQAYDYYDSVVRTDINKADGINKNPETVRKLMRSYARNQGCSIPYSNIAEDISANESTTISDDTVASYVNALKKIFAVEDAPAWSPNLRSKTAIRTSDTRYFVDPSIAVAALGLGPNDLINDLNTFGLLFETMCVRDLRVYAESLKGKVYHYRDKDKLECDAIVHLRNGTYGLIEIKLGSSKGIEEAAKNLKKLSDKIDTSKMKSPSFMMVLTGVTNYAYKREDGVYVVPIGCLKN